jgi:hypothetical protein
LKGAECPEDIIEDSLEYDSSKKDLMNEPIFNSDDTYPITESDCKSLLDEDCETNASADARHSQEVPDEKFEVLS